MDMILDSGAFSAWTNNISINREQYADYILSKQDIYRYFVNLDCIPSVPGDTNLTHDKVELAASTGWDNLEYLLSRGVPKDRLLPVFHQGEDFHWLERMRDEGFPYIGISPGNDRQNRERIDWLRECMYYVTDSGGLPYMKWHGFAATGFNIIPQIPWYSVDSISYALIAGYGHIFIPHLDSKGYNFTREPLVVTVTDRRDKQGQLQNTDIFYSEKGRQYVSDYLQQYDIPIGESTYRTEKVGYKANPACDEHVRKNKDDPETVTVETKLVKGVVNDWLCRTLVNALYFAYFENQSPIWPYPHKTKTMHFGLARKAARSTKTSTIQGVGEPIRIYYASAIHKMNYMRAGVQKHAGRDQYRQLVSYHYSGNCTRVEKQYKEWNDGIFDPNNM